MINKRTLRNCCAAALSTAFLLALAPAGSAAPLVYTVTLNVGALSTSLNGPYSLDLQLVPGSDNITNTVTISNFSVSGGSFTGSPTFTMGGESGSTASSVVLTNSNSEDNEFAQAFTGSTTQITFKVTESNNQETVGSGSPVPDQFNIAIFDTNGVNITTTDPSGSDELISQAMRGVQGTGQIEVFQGNGEDGNGVVTVIPEPRSTAMLSLGGALLALWGFRRKNSKARA